MIPKIEATWQCQLDTRNALSATYDGAIGWTFALRESDKRVFLTHEQAKSLANLVLAVISDTDETYKSVQT